MDKLHPKEFLLRTILKTGGLKAQLKDLHFWSHASFLCEDSVAFGN
jgi:hypothetical protein